MREHWYRENHFYLMFELLDSKLSTEGYSEVRGKIVNTYNDASAHLAISKEYASQDNAARLNLDTWKQSEDSSGLTLTISESGREPSHENFDHLRFSNVNGPEIIRRKNRSPALDDFVAKYGLLKVAADDSYSG